MYQIIILAAGKGTRMKYKGPKVLAPIADRSMIEHLLGNLDTDKLNRSIIVVGYMADLIKKTLGENMNYVTQVNQLGTAHAVQAACPSLQEDADCVVVLYGDQPLVDQIMVDRLVQEHEGSHGPVTMASVQVSDFDSWRSAFEFYGRIIRNEDQSITKIVEYKDANDAEKQVTEVNPAYFVFNKDWLCQNLSQIQTSNAQNEFYLTDLVQLAFKQGHNITAVPIDPQKGLGANTAEQLKVLESIVIK